MPMSFADREAVANVSARFKPNDTIRHKTNGMLLVMGHQAPHQPMFWAMEKATPREGYIQAVILDRDYEKVTE